MANGLPCSRPVRIQLIWEKNRDLLAQSIQDSPNGTDSQYRLNSVHCGPIDAASQLTERESYSFIMKMITRKDVPQYTLRDVESLAVRLVRSGTRNLANQVTKNHVWTHTSNLPPCRAQLGTNADEPGNVALLYY
jgi:hypothetical protein